MRQLPTAVRAKRRVGRPKRLINGGRAEITYEHDRYERRGVSALGSTSRGAFALLEATDLLPMLILPIITKNYANASSAQVSKWEAMRRNKERHNTRALV